MAASPSMPPFGTKARFQSKKSAPVKQENVSANLEEDIRHRAYEHVQRGRKDGHDLDDWLRAEEEIKWTRTRRAAA